ETAANRAPEDESKPKKQASPSVPKRTPPYVSAVAERIARYRSSTAEYASPTDSRSRVDDSMSVKSSVTSRARCTAAHYSQGTKNTRGSGSPAGAPRRRSPPGCPAGAKRTGLAPRERSEAVPFLWASLDAPPRGAAQP